MESKYRPPMCSQTHAHKLCAVSVCTLPISPSYPCACACALVMLVAIWQAILQKPAAALLLTKIASSNLGQEIRTVLLLLVTGEVI